MAVMLRPSGSDSDWLLCYAPQGVTSDWLLWELSSSIHKRQKDVLCQLSTKLEMYVTIVTILIMGCVLDDASPSYRILGNRILGQ